MHLGADWAHHWGCKLVNSYVYMFVMGLMHASRQQSSIPLMLTFDVDIFVSFLHVYCCGVHLFV